MYQQEIIAEMDTILDRKEEIYPGMIIEAGGVVIRNPLDELLALMERFRPFIQSPGSNQKSNPTTNTQSQKPQSAKQSARQGTSPNTASDPFAMFSAIREDLDKSDMTDIILETQYSEFPRIILTVLKDFGTGRTIDSLLGANVGVLGKVTAVQTDGDPVKLLRRSILGVMPTNLRDETFQRVDQSFGVQNSSGYLEVEPPYVQIMPLAIFV